MKKRWRTREVIFSDSDVSNFAGVLRSHYPRLRILRFDHWTDRNVDRLPNSGPSITYRETLANAGSNAPANYRDWLQQVWLEPDGWTPLWSGLDDMGYQDVTNPPTCAFTWYRPHLLDSSWFHEPGRWRLLPGRIAAHLADGDKEHHTFLNKVLRTVARLSTNKTPLHYHDSENGEIRGPNVHNYLWIGYVALDWVREDARRCFFYCHRPSDSIEGVSIGSE
jgi:hypothetical protein